MKKTYTPGVYVRLHTWNLMKDWDLRQAKMPGNYSAGDLTGGWWTKQDEAMVQEFHDTIDLLI